MSSLPVQGDSPVPDRRIGPGIVGYAYLPGDDGPRVGLCVRRRPDGAPRLVFDLLVYFQRQSQHDVPQMRLLRTEVTPDDLPDGINVLIGQRNWMRLRNVTRPPGSDPWRSLPSSSDTSVWQGKLVSLLDWQAALRWPVSASYPGLLPPPHIGIPVCRLAILHSDEPVCVVNRRWLESLRHGRLRPPKLFSDDEYTYFFPGIQP